MKSYINPFLIGFVFIFSSVIKAQNIDFNNGKKYTIGEITVTGNTSFSSQTIVAYSGLRKGETIVIPGEQISNALKKLWGSNLFSSIDIYLTKVEGDTAYLEINLVDLPELNEVKVEGVKKSKVEGIIKDNKLNKGAKVTENLITTTRNYLTSKYKKEGFLNAKVTVNTKEVKDSIQKSRVNMLVYIDKGDKVKIDKITFNGNNIFSGKKLRKAMKKTKQKNPIRIFKRSKYIEDDYKEDLTKVIDKYKENGYRDARILSDTIIKEDDNTISLNIDLAEGEQYKFGKITFVGNSVYTDRQLQSVLRIKEGSTYNGVEL
ncbi:MAG TPA: POTRA domain-containing protein, partial [Flavobacteriaceae bacterium]|nr:POTRA domain-containing protein [Flavobacteriaceae bacterium]